MSSNPRNPCNPRLNAFQSGMHIGAIYLAQPHMDFIEESIESLSACTAPIVIVMQPSLRLDPETAGRIQTICANKKAHTLSIDWQDRHTALNAAAKALVIKGATHALLPDPQDVFSGHDLANLFQFVAAHSEAAAFQLRFHHYWRNLSYRIEPLDTAERTIVISFTRPQSTPAYTGQHFCSIPLDVAVGHNFSFASPRISVRSRLDEILPNPKDKARWMREVWDAWDVKRGLRHLHPSQSERFRSAVAIHPLLLPDVLKNHFYALESRKKPSCSVVFEAIGGLDSVRSLVERTAATLPHDCEVLACVPASDWEVLHYLTHRSGVEVVPVEAKESRLRSWEAGVRAAKAELLVFIHPQIQVFGDWIEGITDALERRTSQIVLPRIQLLHDLPDDFSAADFFEQQRGRFFGVHTAIRIDSLEQLDCWACRREDQGVLQSNRSLTAEEIEDTVVFGSTSARIPQSIPFLSIDPPSKSGIQASIVIPAFNNLSFTKSCIESIFQNTPSDLYELIVVDNGSTDGTAEYFQGLPQVRYIRNRKNLFFARGSNRGGWAALAENIVFLNNDTQVKTGWLEALLEPVANHGGVGIVGNQQLFPDNHAVCPGRVWHAGIAFGNDKNPWHVFYGYSPDHPLVNRQMDFEAVSGCCMLIRRELFQQLGGFDARYQNGFEDVDLCLRVRNLGFRVVYTPASKIVHFVSSSESRFDRDADNHALFRKEWADRIKVTDVDAFRAAGLLTEVELRTSLRIGFISAFNQRRQSARYAKQLLSTFPKGTFTVLSEIAPRDADSSGDSPSIIRAWDRTGVWYYPLLRYASGLDFDIVHVNFDAALFPPTFLEFLSAVQHEGKLIVLTIHETGLDRKYLQKACSLVHAVIVHSRIVYDEVLIAGGDPARIHIIPFGVPAVTASRQRARQKLCVPRNPYLVAILAPIEPGGGILETLQIIAALRNRVDAGCIILDSAGVQNDSYRQLCDVEIRKLGLEGSVQFADGPQELGRLQEYLACASVVVLPGSLVSSESTENAALAASAELPVIASASMELGDAVFNIGSVSLQDALEAVWSDPIFSNELRKRARLFAQAHSWEVAGGAHQNLYRRLMEESHRPSILPVVRWEGPQMVQHSLALVNRELELALMESRQIQLNVIPDRPDSFALSLNDRVRSIEELYCRGSERADIHVRHQWPPNWNAPAGGRWVLIQPWEYGCLPDEWVVNVERSVDEVWAPSTFVRDLYIESGVSAGKVHVVPNGVDVDVFKPGLQAFDLPTARAFKFLFVGGTIHRKGIDILLKSYRASFGPEDDVVLVIKDVGARDIYQGQGIGETIRQMQRDTTSPEVVYLEQDLTDTDVARLYNACDCLVHPYRGEGFGLPVLEAMACGLPVIVTAGGSTDDFVDDESAVRIPATKQVFGNRTIGHYHTSGDLWLLEPDESRLSQAMLHLYREPERAKQLGVRARQKVIGGWTWAHAAKKALARIDALNKCPIFRLQKTADAAVLLDVANEPWNSRIAATLDSLERNAYARLEIFIRANELTDELQRISTRSNVTLLEASFEESIEAIRQKVRVPYLVVLTGPLRFSRHWLEQVAKVASLAGTGSRILVPASKGTGSLEGAPDPSTADEHDFQKYARRLWRNNREHFEEIPARDFVCAIVSSECLGSGCRSSSSGEWFVDLQNSGARTYLVRDTYVDQPFHFHESEQQVTSREEIPCQA